MGGLVITRALARSTCVLVPVAVLLGSAQASGQTERRAPFVRLYSGVGVTGPSDLRIRQPARGTDLTFEGVSWDHKSLSTNWSRDSIPYVGVRAGFFLREPHWLGLSIEVLHFKVLAKEEQRVRARGTKAGISVDTVAPLRQFVQQ